MAIPSNNPADSMENGIQDFGLKGRDCKSQQAREQIAELERK